MGKEISAFGNSKFKKNLTTINVIILILIASYFIISSQLQEVIAVRMIDGPTVEVDNGDFRNPVRDFSYYVKDKDDPVEETFVAKVSKAKILALGESDLQIFTPMIQSEAFKLYINDKLVAIEGDAAEYNSNIWAMKFDYTVSVDIFDKEINEIKIVQYSRYMGGALGTPFIIAGYQSSSMLRDMSMFEFHQGLIGIAIGMAVFLFLLIILLPSRRKVYYMILASLILMSVGYMEYFSIQNIGFDYLIFKKIVISATLLAVGLGTALFRDLFVSRKHILKIILIYSIVIMVPTLFVDNMIDYKKTYTILSLLVVPTLVYWGYIAMKNYKIYEEGKMVLTMTATFIAYIIIWNIGEATGLAYLPSSTEVMLPLFMMLGLALIIIDIHELRLHVARNRIKYNEAYKKSIVDGLTGLYNAKYMKEILHDLIGPYTVAMVDIDDFKDINDKHGHLAGDKALISFSNTVRRLLREEDFLGRYGGDEFIFVLSIANKDDAEKILERIRFTVENESLEYEGKEIHMTISIGFYIAQGNENFEYIIAKADKALYMAKNSGKNIVCNIENFTDEQIIFDELGL